MGTHVFDHRTGSSSPGIWRHCGRSGLDRSGVVCRVPGHVPHFGHFRASRPAAVIAPRFMSHHQKVLLEVCSSQECVGRTALSGFRFKRVVLMTRKLISLVAVMVAVANFTVGSNDAEARHCRGVRNRCCVQHTYNLCGLRRNTGCGYQQHCNTVASQPCCNASINQATYHGPSSNGVNAAAAPMAPPVPTDAPAPNNAPVPAN